MHKVDVLVWIFAGQRHMLVERYNQYKTAAVKAKQAGNDEVAVRHIRTAKVIVGLI